MTVDPRTKTNPLVPGEPHLRFYAGAPLSTRYGVGGALCVIDVKPRSEGLTERQLAGLQRLAIVASALLDMRRDAVDSKEATDDRREIQRSLEASERKWRDLYRTMEQGFVYAHVLRDAAGRVVDWRYDEVNAA